MRLDDWAVCCSQEKVDPELLAEFATLSGFLCHAAGEIATAGATHSVANIHFEVLEADERRLLSVRATNTTPASLNATVDEGGLPLVGKLFSRNGNGNAAGDDAAP